MLLAPSALDALTAWSTFGGAAGSILAVVVAGLLLYHERRSRNVEQRDNEAAGARLVTVEVDTWLQRDGKITNLQVSIVNHGSEPILQVDAVARLAQTNDEFRLPRRRYVLPHEPYKLPWLLKTPIAVDMETTLLEFFVTGEVTFTDSRGLRWIRRGWDQPERWVANRSISRRQRLRWWINRRRSAVGALIGRLRAR